MPKAKDTAEPLSDNEGSLLGLLERLQPLTAYQLYKIHEESPVSRFNTSKGSVYPLIGRLKARGYISAKPKAEDGRNSEDLFCTAKGARAVASWAMDLKLAHVMLDDPLRTKLLSLGTADKSELIEWIVNAKSLVEEKRKQIDDYNAAVSVPFQSIVYKSSVDMLRVKMEWLDHLLYEVVQGQSKSG